MKRLQAFKFQLRPNGQQERDMRRFAGACRFVFNRALALQNENNEAGNKYIPYAKMVSWLIEWKSDTEILWQKEALSQPLQQSLKDLERAYKNFFQKRAAFPRFKKRGQNDAFRYPQGFSAFPHHPPWARVLGVFLLSTLFTLTWITYFSLSLKADWL